MAMEDPADGMDALVRAGLVGRIEAILRDQVDQTTGQSLEGLAGDVLDALLGSDPEERPVPGYHLELRVYGMVRTQGVLAGTTDTPPPPIAGLYLGDVDRYITTEEWYRAGWRAFRTHLAQAAQEERADDNV